MWVRKDNIGVEDGCIGGEGGRGWCGWCVSEGLVWVAYGWVGCGRRCLGEVGVGDVFLGGV